LKPRYVRLGTAASAKRPQGTSKVMTETYRRKLSPAGPAAHAARAKFAKKPSGICLFRD
jgi:hypothetical protein